MTEISFDNIKAIILAGSFEFGRFPLMLRVPKIFWPVAGKTAIQRLIDGINRRNIHNIVVCTNFDNELSGRDINAGDIKFLKEKLPRGTGGCLRDAAEEKDSLFVLFNPGINPPTDIDECIERHLSLQTDITILFDPAENGSDIGSAQIYICNPSVLEYIPSGGYFDIKENLVPAMVQADKKIRAEKLMRNFGNFCNWQEYLSIVKDFLSYEESKNELSREFKQRSGEDIWLGRDVKIGEGVRIYGPVVIANGAKIGVDAVILGPTLIENEVEIGKGSLITGSIIWRNCRIGSDCRIEHSLIGDGAAVTNGKTVIGEVKLQPEGTITAAIDKLRVFISEKFTSGMSQRLQYHLKEVNVGAAMWTTAFIGVFLWLYLPELRDLFRIWLQNDEYSSGLLVPFLAGYVLWNRRDSFLHIPRRPSLWGLVAFAAAQGIRYFGLFFAYSSAERFSIILSITSLIYLFFGWRILRHGIFILLFLCLMLPLPRSVHTAIMLPLQNLSTVSAVFFLETLGYVAVREGNIIHIGQTSVAVAEACNGLRMITAFFVINGFVVLLSRRAMTDKIIILLSSLPISLFCNTVRLAATAIAFTMINGDQWEKVFHDFGGLAMMPLALAIVVFELWFLSRLRTEPLAYKSEIVNNKISHRR